ncbi:hypothetical protein FJ420_21345 [Mesorhizobium sp. B3-1-3]|uniref:hypothetical protein n=1 Tax=unclassified Mesorhizobium TaxID=325217 RepID=UPI00112A72E1|nr:MULTISPECIES: hypothetical protein [unclassified Mesorhizobium]TPI59854.1 hypothetical protein FJ424_24730 [Mesorhizobium sp. B3-1-8]TPI68234.1 hypothetical protein FJ420_21345 [Mesorhizobium sp. B3-1-3]
MGYNLVFWEAKLYGNSDLFTDRVLKQVKRYHGQIERHQKALVEQYRAVCAFQAEILKMRLDRRTPGIDSSDIEVMERLAKPESPLGVDVRPRILAFGYDGQQRERWKKREEELQAELGAKNRVRGIGKPYGGFLGVDQRMLDRAAQRRALAPSP